MGGYPPRSPKAKTHVPKTAMPATAQARTRIRQRITAERPYKVPETDGRRIRYALPVIRVSASELAMIQTTVRVAVCEVLRIFRVEKPIKPKPQNDR